MVKISKRAFFRWDRRMRRRLRHATFAEGYMWKFARKQPASMTYVALSDRQVMGWCLVFVHEGRAIVSVYVNARYRRSGLARRMLERVLGTHREITVAVWDRSSRLLYRGLRDRYPDRVVIVNWWKALPKYRTLIAKHRS